jgi:hypothetical protein
VLHVIPPPYLNGGTAFVFGYPATVFSKGLRAAWDRGDFDHLDSRDELYAHLKAMEYAAYAHEQRRVSAAPSAVGSPDPNEPEIGAQSSHDMSIDEAAGVLGVTPRRVRQLAPLGLGHKVGATWVCDRAAVMAEAERRRAA